MIVKSEEEMLELGREAARALTLPAVFELVGDVGTGKTTFTRGLAAGLGVQDPVTSPSFTVSKRYAFTPYYHARSTEQNNMQSAELVHYDFYRLDDPGIMRDELDETLAEPNSVVVVEWGGDVSDLLPGTKYRLEFILNPDDSRSVKLNQNAQTLLLNSISRTDQQKPVITMHVDSGHDHAINLLSQNTVSKISQEKHHD